jgi:hypothetical protein
MVSTYSTGSRTSRAPLDNRSSGYRPASAPTPEPQRTPLDNLRHDPEHDAHDQRADKRQSSAPFEDDEF